MIICSIYIIVRNGISMLVVHDSPLGISLNPNRFSTCYSPNFYSLNSNSFFFIQPNRIIIQIGECLGSIPIKLVESLLK